MRLCFTVYSVCRMNKLKLDSQVITWNLTYKRLLFDNILYIGKILNI